MTMMMICRTITSQISNSSNSGSRWILIHYTHKNLMLELYYVGTVCILSSAGAQLETGRVKPRHLVHPQKL